VIPVEQVLRMTVPYLTSPDPDRKSGFGDTTFLDVFVPRPTPKDVLGIGFTMTIPTASDSRRGSGYSIQVTFIEKLTWPIRGTWAR